MRIRWVVTEKYHGVAVAKSGHLTKFGACYARRRARQRDAFQRERLSAVGARLLTAEYGVRRYVVGDQNALEGWR